MTKQKATIQDVLIFLVAIIAAICAIMLHILFDLWEVHKENRKTLVKVEEMVKMMEVRYTDDQVAREQLREENAKFAKIVNDSIKFKK